MCANRQLIVSVKQDKENPGSVTYTLITMKEISTLITTFVPVII